MSLTVLESFCVAFAMLSFLSGLLFSLLFLFLRELRKGPGSIIQGQCVAQMLLDLHWLTLKGIYEHGDSSGCEVLGFIGVFAYILAFNYAAAMSVIIVRHFYEPFLGGKHLLLYHSLCISTAFLLSLSFYFLKCTGDSIIGTCFFKSHSNAEYCLYRIVQLVFLLLYTPLCVGFCLYFVRKFQHNQKFTYNSVAVVLAFAGTWVGVSIIHFLSWKYTYESVPHAFDAVASSQIAVIACALSGLITVAIRLLHAPIRQELMLKLSRSGQAYELL